MNYNDKDYQEYPVPPEYVFKYRNRSRTVPEKQVLDQEETMFVGKGIKYPALHKKSDKELEELGVKRSDLLPVTDAELEIGGQLRVFEGVPYPAKGHPFPPAFYGINGAKRITLNTIKMLAGKDMLLTLAGFMITPKKYKVKAITRAMFYYQDSMRMFIEPFIVEDEFCKPFTRELRKFLDNFFCSFGMPFYGVDQAMESFVMEFEYDDAYTFRVEDGMSMTTKERMMENPSRELTLIFRTIAERNHYDGQPVDKGMDAKFKAIENALKIAFWIPGVKKAFREALKECDFRKLQLDDADRYFTLMWPDYQFQGKTQEERWEIFKKIHEKDGLPPRLVWRKIRPDEAAKVTPVPTPK